MLSRKGKDKTRQEGVVGKYVKKETPPDMPSEFLPLHIMQMFAAVEIFNAFFFCI